MPPNSRFQSSRAFTIMEVALAATVLALTLVGMIGVIEAGSQMLDLSRKQTIAEQIIHSEIEQLHLQSWSTVSSIPASLTQMTSTGTGPLYLDPAFPTTFTCMYQALPVNDAAGNPINNFVQVTFVVSWTGITGIRYTRTGTTLAGLNGLYLSYQRS